MGVYASKNIHRKYDDGTIKKILVNTIRWCSFNDSCPATSSHVYKKITLHFANEMTGNTYSRVEDTMNDMNNSLRAFFAMYNVVEDYTESLNFTIQSIADFKDTLDPMPKDFFDLVQMTIADCHDKKLTPVRDETDDDVINYATIVYNILMEYPLT